MNETVWKFFMCMYDDETWPNPDAGECIKACWEDGGSVISDLFDAYSILLEANCNEEVYRQLEKKSDEYVEVGALFIRGHLPIAASLLVQGQKVQGKAAVDFLVQQFETGGDEVKGHAAFMLAELGPMESKAKAALVAVLDGELGKSVENVRRAAALALGRIGDASSEVVKALADVAGDANETQSLRSYCIEALMDLGPAASSSATVLRQVFHNDEDENLRHFAWAALKSVTASSEDHESGGTVAEHMRSLYRVE